MAVSSAARSIAIAAASDGSVVTRSGTLNPLVQERFLLQDPELQGLATVIARADVRLRFGTWDEAQQKFTPLEGSTFTIDSSGVEAAAGEQRDPIESVDSEVCNFVQPFASSACMLDIHAQGCYCTQ